MTDRPILPTNIRSQVATACFAIVQDHHAIIRLRS